MSFPKASPFTNGSADNISRNNRCDKGIPEYDVINSTPPDRPRAYANNHSSSHSHIICLHNSTRHIRYCTGEVLWAMVWVNRKFWKTGGAITKQKKKSDGNGRCVCKSYRKVEYCWSMVYHEPVRFRITSNSISRRSSLGRSVEAFRITVGCLFMDRIKECHRNGERISRIAIC